MRAAQETRHHADASIYLASFGINDMPAHWQDIEPVLAQACAASEGEFTPQMILNQMGLMDGVEIWRLLALYRDGALIAVMVVSISEMPVTGVRILECILAGGQSAKEWVLADPQLDAIARDWGCTKIRIPCARKGWFKTLSHWRLRGHVLERRISATEGI